MPILCFCRPALDCKFQLLQPRSALPELLLAAIFLGDLRSICWVSHPHPDTFNNICRYVGAPFALCVIALGVFAVQGASRCLDNSPGTAKLYAHLRSGPKMSGLASTTLKSTK